MIRESAHTPPLQCPLSAVFVTLIRSTTVTERIYFADVVNTHPNNSYNDGAATHGPEECTGKEGKADH